MHALDGRELSTLVTALAKAPPGLVGADFFDRVAVRVVAAGADDVEPRALSGILWAAVQARFRNDALLDAVVGRVVADAHRFDQHSVSSVAWALARSRVRHGAAFGAIARRAIAIMGTCTPHSVASLAWAFATVGDRHDALFAAIAARIQADPRGFTGQALANAAWAFATVRIADPDLFAVFAAADVAAFNPQELVNVAWAFATLGVRDQAAFVGGVARRAAAHADRLTAQQVSNLAWALATLGVRRDDAVFDAIGRATLRLVDTFAAQAVATTAWAYAQVGARAGDAPVLVALRRRAIAQVHAFTPQGLAMTASAFASVAGAGDADLFRVIARRATRDMDAFAARDLTTLSWAFAQVDSAVLAAAGGADDLFRGVGRRALAVVDTFVAVGLARTTRAFARVRVAPSGLFAAMARRVVDLAATFSPESIGNCAWAFATVGYAGDDAADLFGALARRALDVAGAFDAPALADTAWAFAQVAAPTHDGLFRALGRRAVVVADAFTAEQVAATASAFAQVGALDDAAVVDALGRRALALIDAFDAPGVVRVLRAFTSTPAGADVARRFVRERLPVVVDDLPADGVVAVLVALADAGGGDPMIVERVVGRADAVCTAGDVARALRACVGLRVRRDAHLVTTLLDASLASVEALDAQGVADLSWALVELDDDRCADLAVALAYHGATVARECTGAAIATILSACARLGVGARDAPATTNLFAKLGRRVAIRPDLLPDGDALARTAWAVASATIRFSPFAGGDDDDDDRAELAEYWPEAMSVGLTYADLFASLGRQCVAVIAGDDVVLPGQVATLCRAFAATGTGTGAVYDALVARAVSALDAFDRAALSDLLWALAVADVAVDDRVAVAFLRRAAALLDDDDGVLQAATRRWLLAMGPERSSDVIARASLSGLPCLTSPVSSSSSSSDPGAVSALQSSVVETLQAVQAPGSRLVAQYVCPDTACLVDIAFPGAKVAVQVHDPARFRQDVQSGRLQLDGDALLTQRLLRRHGWAVVSVDFAEWIPLHAGNPLHDHPGKVAFLRSRLPASVLQ